MSEGKKRDYGVGGTSLELGVRSRDSTARAGARTGGVIHCGDRHVSASLREPVPLRTVPSPGTSSLGHWQSDPGCPSSALAVVDLGGLLYNKRIIISPPALGVPRHREVARITISRPLDRQSPIRLSVRLSRAVCSSSDDQASSRAVGVRRFAVPWPWSSGDTIPNSWVSAPPFLSRSAHVRRFTIAGGEVTQQQDAGDA